MKKGFMGCPDLSNLEDSGGIFWRILQGFPLCMTEPLDGGQGLCVLKVPLMTLMRAHLPHQASWVR